MISLTFVLSLLSMSVASVVLTDALKTIAARLRFPDALLGIFTALGADSPEIASAFVAFSYSYHDIGLSIILGSNIFNLAGLLGLSALVAGRLQVSLKASILDIGANLVVTAIAATLVLRLVSPAAALALIVLVLVPYFIATGLKPKHVERLKLGIRLEKFLIGLARRVPFASHHEENRSSSIWMAAARAVVAVAAVAGASLFMVRSAVTLADGWHLSHVIVGTLVLASLTSIPNVLAALRLATDGRGIAVVSTTFNSNTFNILAGLGAAGVAIGLGKPSPQIVFSAIWLVGMSLYAMKCSSSSEGIRRRDGVVLIALYAVFAVVIASWR